MSHTPLPATAPAQPPDPAGLIASGRRVLEVEGQALAAVGASLTAWICGVTGCGAAPQPWWWGPVR
ncbi:MAG TPA: hypothetical protein PLO34_05355, partial [Pseudoxanthomonas sp.]|nr:hypothetical protein [Pseudoxanthomonas sp.]